MRDLGVALTWYGDLAEARQVQNQVLAEVERVGTQNGRSMALTELAVTACAPGRCRARTRAGAAGVGGGSGAKTGSTWRLRGVSNGGARGLGGLA